MLDAFINNVVNIDPESKEAHKRRMNVKREEERAEEQAEVEQRRAERAEAIAARQAEKAVEKNRRVRVELREEIRKLSEVKSDYERLFQAAKSERGQLVQARQIQRTQLSIADLQAKLAALPVAGGQRGGTSVYKTNILPNFQTEMQYIMLLSFYPIYINQENNGNPLSEEEYMSIPSIAKKANDYFQPRQTQLIDLGSQKVVIHAMTRPSMTRPSMTRPYMTSLPNTLHNMLSPVAAAAAAPFVSSAQWASSAQLVPAASLQTNHHNIHMDTSPAAAVPPVELMNFHGGKKRRTARAKRTRKTKKNRR